MRLYVLIVNVFDVFWVRFFRYDFISFGWRSVQVEFSMVRFGFVVLDSPFAMCVFIFRVWLLFYISTLLYGLWLSVCYMLLWFFVLLHVFAWFIYLLICFRFIYSILCIIFFVSSSIFFLFLRSEEELCVVGEFAKNVHTL